MYMLEVFVFKLIEIFQDQHHMHVYTYTSVQLIISFMRGKSKGKTEKEFPQRCLHVQ